MPNVSDDIEYQKEWKRQNKEAVKKAQKTWRDKNKKHIAQYNKVWYKANKVQHLDKVTKRRIKKQKEQEG